jgi:hypothetical protein
MANTDTLLVWMIAAQFAFLVFPGLAWIVDRAFHGSRKPPVAWSGNRLHSHRSRFQTYRAGGIVRDVRHA